MEEMVKFFWNASIAATVILFDIITGCTITIPTF